MNELFDFGKYGPYIAAAYSISIILLGGLIHYHRTRLAKARDAEKRQSEEKTR